MSSLKVALKTHPREPYSTDAFNYLCNSFPKIPDLLIRHYLDYYAGLLIPTFRSFKKYFEEKNGSFFLNSAPISPQNPPRRIVQISSTDPCYLEDLEILKNDQEVNKYIMQYTSMLKSGAINQHTNANSNQNQHQLITCADCKTSQPDVSSVSCSEGHICCLKCLQKMVWQTLGSGGSKLICRAANVECMGVFERVDVERLIEPSEMAQLVTAGVFKQQLHHQQQFASLQPSALASPPSHPSSLASSAPSSSVSPSYPTLPVAFASPTATPPVYASSAGFPPAFSFSLPPSSSSSSSSSSFSFSTFASSSPGSGSGSASGSASVPRLPPPYVQAQVQGKSLSQSQHQPQPQPQAAGQTVNIGAGTGAGAGAGTRGFAGAGSSSSAGAGVAGQGQGQKQWLRRMTLQEENQQGFLCPISKKIMIDPVVCSDTYVYERANIRSFVDLFQMSPMTFEDLNPSEFEMAPEDEVRKRIQEYLRLYPDRGNGT